MENYPLCCYSNGEIVVDGENVSYKNGEQSFVFVDVHTSFNELTKLICEELEVDINKFDVVIKMKFPSVRGYKLITLKNDKGMRAMWASIGQSKAASMDLYVECVPIESQNQSMTQLLCEVMNDVNDMVNLSLSANNIDQDLLMLNEENGDEDEDLLMLNEENGDNVDLVTPTAPSQEFATLHPLDIDWVNSWHGKKANEYDGLGEFDVGQRFNNKLTLSQHVRQYHIQKNQIYKTVESKSHTVTYKCNRKPNSCHWTLRATQKEVTHDAFTIVTYNGPHHPSCVVDAPPLDHPNLTNAFIAKHIRNLVDKDWGVQISLLRTSITDSFNFTPSYMKTWHAKQRAIAELYGDWEDSYALLPRYLQAVKEANPGTVVHFVNRTTSAPNVEKFDRVFWAFGPSIRGFEHCRPVITIDGTHLYGKYKGVLLIAIGIDANDQIFPLAFAIVDCESVDTWGWFMGCIRRSVSKRVGLCVISDRHKGIMRVMNEGHGWTEPLAYHRFCVRHFASNVATRYGGKDLKEAFIETANAEQPKKFKRGMRKIGEIDARAKAELEKIPASKWALSEDGGHRYGVKTTNNSECFNGVLKRVRFLPITALVKATFFRLNSYFVERRDAALTKMNEGQMWSDKVKQKLDANIERAAHHKVTCYNIQQGIYEVVTGRGHRLTSEGNHAHTVNLSKRTCSCNKWQIYHYPCSHVMAVCRAYAISSDQYVDPFYSCSEYFAAYRSSFHPVADEDYWMPWNGPMLIPDPFVKRGGGRPKSSRIHNEMDQRSTVTCSVCGKEGHNKRRCTSKASSSGNSA